MIPLDGAADFLDWLRSNIQIFILSDTFIQFAGPLMKKLNWPTLLCHTLSIDDKGFITGYNLRHECNKQATVESLKNLNYKVIGVGDSYNDIDMLKAADLGILYHPPENVRNEFPEFNVSLNYDDLKRRIQEMISYTY